MKIPIKINKWGIGHVFLFLIISIFVYIITAQFDSIAAFVGLLLISIVWGLYHFFKAIVLLFLKNRKSGFQSLISFFLLLNIAIKLTFVFYNILIYLLIVVIGVILLLRKSSYPNTNDKTRTILSLLIGINTILVFVPNKTTFLLLNSDAVFWGNDLTWNDFRGDPDPEINHDVQLWNGFAWFTNRVYNYPTVVTATFADPKLSWKKDSCCSNADEVLRHEQGHFDIVEIYRRMAVDSANSSWGTPASNIEIIMQYFRDECQKKGERYDSLTKHGTNRTMQKKWNEEIKIRLEK